MGMIWLCAQSVWFLRQHFKTLNALFLRLNKHFEYNYLPTEYQVPLPRYQTPNHCDNQNWKPIDQYVH
jgi:hypothetical protein